jgi:hypothetical protein
MVDLPDDDPIEDVLARARGCSRRYAVWLDPLREGDTAFAEASALHSDDMAEWQSAVYLLTGNDAVWAALGGEVIGQRSVAPARYELEAPRRVWSSSEDAVMAWAAHFWDIDRGPTKFPYVFEQFLFYRWITACHLRQRIPPALTVTTTL